MNFEVNGQLVPNQRISYRDRDFGRAAPGFDVRRYTLRMPIAEFVQAFGRWYGGYAEDDRKVGNDTEIPLDLELRKLGWPSLDELARTRPDLLRAFALEYPMDVVHEILRPHSAGTPQDLVINSVRDVAVRGDQVVLEGDVIEARPAPSGRAYANPKCARRGQPVAADRKYCGECSEPLS